MSHINFHNLSKTKNDSWVTPTSAWIEISPFIPTDKTIWEPFWCDGKSGEDLKSLGFEVIHKPNEDFFKTDYKESIIVTNPPFSKIKQILKRLVFEFDRPFILIIPISKLGMKYFQDTFRGKQVQIIIPKRRIHFEGIATTSTKKSKCYFDCCYLCYRLHLERDLIFL